MLKIRAGASKKVGCTRWRNMLTGWRIDGVTRVLSGFSVPYSSVFNIKKVQDILSRQPANSLSRQPKKRSTG